MTIGSKIILREPVIVVEDTRTVFLPKGTIGSVGMLRALDVYDPARYPNLDAYLMRRLDQKLLGMLPPSKRYGVPYAPRKKGFRVDSLDAMGLTKAVPVKVKKRKGKPFQLVRRLRCWLARKEAVPCAKSAV